MLDHGREVLVSSDVDRIGSPNCLERPAAARLRPAVRVEVGVQAIVELAVDMGGSAEAGL